MVNHMRGINKYVTSITNKVMLMEASGKRGIRYRYYKLILSLHRQLALKESKTRWFWFFGRFRLPPYWWHTKAFKVLTIIAFCILLSIGGIYIYNNYQAESIVSSIDTSYTSDISLSSSSIQSSTLNSNTSGLGIYSGNLYTQHSDGSIEYNFLKKNLSDAQSKNADTVGWLELDYCGISYPVVRGTDNDFYLTHDFNKNSNSHGWVFMDYRSTPNQSKNTVIYGHNLMAGGMFSSLSDILKAQSSIYIKFQSLTTTSIYEVFSVYTTAPDAYYIKQDFDNDELTEFYDSIKLRNEWSKAPALTLTTSDSVLTLSTCYGNDRLVVHSKLLVSSVL